MMESVRNNLGQQNVGDGFRRGWGTMDRARNNLVGQNEGDGRRRWGTLDSVRNKLTQNNAGDGAAGGWVRWIGRATSSRDKTSGMSLVVSL